MLRDALPSKSVRIIQGHGPCIVGKEQGIAL